MSDIDFDELDRAVNSLMNKRQGQVDDKPTAVNEQAGVTSDKPADSTDVSSELKPSLPVNDKPEINNKPELSNNLATPKPTSPSVSSSPTIRQSPGRFMDVMPPNPTKSMSARPVNKLPVRNTGMIQPMSQPASNESTSAPSSQEAEFVDPVASTPNVTEPKSEAKIVSPLAPMESPFLSDVAVDKRPLGSIDEVDSSSFKEVKEDQSPEIIDQVPPSGDIDLAMASMSNQDETLASGTDIVSSQESIDDTQEPDNWTTETDERVTETEAYVPPEMGAEVVALESDVAAAKPLVTNQPSDAKFDKKPLSTGSPQIKQPGDIVPQYTPGVADAPEPSAIFEAASESPQNLSHTPKAKSGWFILVWILLLVILGVAGGVAVWWFLIK